jgi:hypothetical protein
MVARVLQTLGPTLANGASSSASCLDVCVQRGHSSLGSVYATYEPVRAHAEQSEHVVKV